MNLHSEEMRRNPYPVYDQLRSTAPVLQEPASGLWMIFDYEGVKRALDEHEAFSSRAAPPGGGPIDWFNPVGMRSRAGKQFALKARPRSLSTMSYEELLAANLIIAGTPDEVADKFALVHREIGVGHLLLEAQESRMDHATTTRSIELMGAKVIPAIAKL